MKNILVVLLIAAATLSIQSCKKKDTTVNCSNPNMTATAGNTAFKACGAYAYTIDVLGDISIGILGQIDAGNLIGFSFTTPDRFAITPGTYQITNGIGASPAGQPCRVNFVYKEGGTALSNSFNSQSGVLYLTQADGTNFAGTFNGTAKRAAGSPDIITVTGGSFNVTFKP